jgi:LacI family transcriptional regulator
VNKKKRPRVTLKQVAKHAGVSTTTASLVVRGSETISKATHEKVLASMKELGYVYDRVAANLSSQTSSTIGLIITEIANPYFSELVDGVHQELDQRGYTVLLGTTSESNAKQELLLSTMLEYRVGGVILCPCADSTLDTIKLFEQWEIPVIQVTNEVKGTRSDYIGVDYKAGARVAVEHLIEKGHRRIAYIGGPIEAYSWKERKEGYSQALEQAGLEMDDSLVFGSAMTREGGIDAARKICRIENPPTAIFCFNDVIAFGVMVGLKDAGFTPGQDIAVVGFDNIKEAATSIPSLTTVTSSPGLIGSYAADLLHQRIAGLETEPQRIILKPEIVERNSTTIINN